MMARFGSFWLIMCFSKIKKFFCYNAVLKIDIKVKINFQSVQ